MNLAVNSLVTTQFKQLLSSKITFYTVLAVFFLLSKSAFAIDANIQVHHGEESGALGYNVGISDTFTKQSSFGWNVSYNHLSELGVTWNDDELFFESDAIEAMLTYSFSPKSYNKFLSSLVFEFQGGASFQLTENKFVWEELEEEKYFSEKNDINVALAFLTHYKFNRKTQFHLGVKYYPQYSEFDGVGTIFAGFTFRFGNQFGY